jgi:adenylate cyclase
MEAMLSVVYPFWSYPPVTFVLYGALVVHMTLALYALWQRRSLRLSLHETVQYVLGFSVPLLLAEHVTSTRIDAAFYGGDFGHYKYLLSALWYGHPEKGVLQMALLLAAWIHACIGLRFWLRVQPWFGAVQTLLFAAALLMPVLALLGYVAGGREIGVMLAQDPGYVARLLAAQPPPEARPALFVITWGIRFVFLGAIVILLIARMVRHEWWRRKGIARISYPDGRSIEVVRGFTVLEASRLLGVPHARDLRRQRSLYDLPRACPRARRASRAGSGGASRPASNRFAAGRSSSVSTTSAWTRRGNAAAPRLRNCARGSSAPDLCARG